MLEQLMRQFLNSTDGTRAREALQREYGLSGPAAEQSLDETARAAESQLPRGDEPSMQAGLLGALAGLAMGGAPGVMGGALAGKAGQMIARRTGLDPRTGAMVAAAAVPFLLRFLQQQQRGAVGAAPAANPGAFPPAATTSEVPSVPTGAKPAMPPGSGAATGPQTKAPMQRGAKTARGEQVPPQLQQPWKRLV